MGCDILTFEALAAELGIPMWAEASEADAWYARMARLLDGALGLVFTYVGHTFGIGVRVYHNGSGDATGATVSITADGYMNLVIIGGSNKGTVQVALENYTVAELADLVNLWEIGWVMEAVCDGEQPACNLAAVSAHSAYKLVNRRNLCLASWTEYHNGGEYTLFLKHPARRFVSVVEDGVTLTQGTHYLYKRDTGTLWRICAGCSGSVDWRCVRTTWSLQSVDNIVVRYVPWWIGPIPALVARVIIDLARLAWTETGYKMEWIGDYRYDRGDIRYENILRQLDGLGAVGYGGGTAGGKL